MHLKWWPKGTLTNMWKYQQPTGQPPGTNRVNTKMQMLLFFRFTQGKMKAHAPGTMSAQNAQTDKALQLEDECNGSFGWLTRLKHQHCIHKIAIQ